MEYLLSHELIAGAIEEVQQAGRDVAGLVHQHTIVAAAVVVVAVVLWRWTTAPPR